MKKCIALLLTVVFVLSMAACAKAPAENSADAEKSGGFPVTVTDQLGREVTIEKAPEKLVSGYYISTSLLIALGQQDKLVGIEAKADTRPIYSLAAPELLDLPSVGTAKEFKLEECAALEPDLVILPAKLKDTIPSLEELGITVIAVNPEDETLMDEAVALLGDATGAAGKADELLAFNDKLTDEITKAVADTEKPSVYLSSNSDLLAAAGGKVYQNTLIDNAGGTNVAAELSDKSWSDVSYEQILAWNPQTIVIAAEADYSVEDVLADASLAGTDAVTNQKVYKFPDAIEAWDAPVPSGVLGTAWLAHTLHPDAYKADSLKQDVTDFYETFYGFTPDTTDIVSE